jgi:UMF1 family MFS transporter
MLVYNDGIGTVIRMAGIYAETLGLPTPDVITAILLVQFVGVPFSFLFGSLAGRIGTKRAILLGLGVYAAITVVAYRLESVWEFYLLAILVAMVQGGTQALSRSLFASMTPKHKTSEFFGFFSVFEKFSGIIGPLLFSVMIALTGSSRNAILAVSSFFVIGGFILTLVRVEEGRRRAWEAEKLVLEGEGRQRQSQP